MAYVKCKILCRIFQNDVNWSSLIPFDIHRDACNLISFYVLIQLLF